jgi:hypothetical protein
MKANHAGQKNSRRIGAKERLHAQLKSGTKRVKNEIVILTESDIKRINKELDTLQSSIKNPEVARSHRSKRKK